MAIEKRFVIQYCDIRDGAGLHGAGIGTIGTGVQIELNMDLQHDGWAPIVGPVDEHKLAPTWKETGKQGWIEVAHTKIISEKQHVYITIIDATTGAVISCTQQS